MLDETLLHQAFQDGIAGAAVDAGFFGNNTGRVGADAQKVKVGGCFIGAEADFPQGLEQFLDILELQLRGIRAVWIAILPYFMYLSILDFRIT